VQNGMIQDVNTFGHGKCTLNLLEDTLDAIVLEEEKSRFVMLGRIKMFRRVASKFETLKVGGVR